MTFQARVLHVEDEVLHIQYEELFFKTQFYLEATAAKGQMVLREEVLHVHHGALFAGIQKGLKEPC